MIRRVSKTILPLLLFLSIGKVGNCQKKVSHSIFHAGTFAEALTEAKNEKKCLFLDAYASWCGPCQTMDKEVYTDSAVMRYFQANFISVRIDMEKGEGPGLAKRLRSIDGYPSLLFFDRDGHLAKTILGSRPAEVFLREAKLVAD